MIPLRVSTNQLGDRVFIAGTDIYKFTSTGYLVSHTENTLGSERIPLMKNCEAISIIETIGSDKVEVASYKDYTTIKSRKIITKAELPKFKLQLKVLKLDSFTEFLHDYTRTVYIVE